MRGWRGPRARETRPKKRLRLSDLLFGGGVLLFPFYVFESGSAQPAHFLFLLLALLYARRLADLKWITHPILLILFLFAAYICIRQVMFSFWAPTMTLTPASFAVYNVVISWAVFQYLRDRGHAGFRIAYWTTALSVGLAVAGLVLGGSSLKVDSETLERSVGTFNNPNQLGYFAVCSAGILTALWSRFDVGRYTFLPAFAASLLASAFSLSKAASISIPIYSLAFLTAGGGRKFAIVILAAAGLFLISGVDLSEYQLFNRLSGIGYQNDDSLQARGYWLMFEPDFDPIFGSGEGYAKLAIGHEVHSTLGNVFISFGLVGLGLLLWALALLARRLIRTDGLLFTAAILSPMLLYGITHNGLRFSIAWVFLAICYASAIERSPQSRRSTAQTRSGARRILS